MARHVMLNNVTHKDLRVITRHGAEFGDKLGTVPTFPTEYGDVQREYPIFFRKEPSGELGSVALLGFAQDENLFLDETGWHARYVPGYIARGPFLIGFQEQRAEGAARVEPVIHVDMDDPRISTSEGEPLFLPQGGNSPYLERVAATLNGLHEGVAIGKAMFAAFTELDLIEPVKLEIRLSAEERYDLVGLYTLSESKLRALDGEPLARLHKSGFLQGAFLVLASLNNVKTLIEMKRQRRARQPS